MSKRSAMVKMLPCIACAQQPRPQPNATEVHHLNLGGHAGQKRLGDAHSIPLCGWHHRAEAPDGYTKTTAKMLWGPSLACNSKEFRAMYGLDDDLKRKTDVQIACIEAAA